MSFELPPLPYSYDALEPCMSTATLEVHHLGHHASYVANLNKLVANTEYENKRLVEIIESTARNENHREIFNNAAQVWNHSFFWSSMKPHGGRDISRPLAAAIDRSFGSLERFRAEFVEASAARFGSGWAWLVVDHGELRITTTPNAELPLLKGQYALLACDLWEHAYYLDYQNRRKLFVETFLKELVNWNFAAENLNKAEIGAAA